MRNKIFIIATVLCISACSGRRTNSLKLGPIDFSRPSVYIPSIPHSSFLPLSSLGPIQFSIPSSSSSVNEEKEDYFNCPKYGPFSLGADDFNATFTYELNTIESQEIIERIRLFNASNSVVASSSKAKISYVQGTLKEVTFLVPIHDYWSENGLTLKFEIINYSTRQIIKQYSASFYPPSHSVLSGDLLKREIYTSRSLGFYGDGEKMNELIEVFDFTNFDEYLDSDYYYRLNIEDSYFIYQSNYSLTYQFINLRFNDDEYLFPYFTHNSNNELVIPLKIRRESQYAYFDFLKTFYFNKTTLEISDSYRQDFVLTSNFYLPINGKKSFNNKRIYLDFIHVGLDDITTTISLKYYADKALVSTCGDGDYCIEGGNR